MKILAGVLGGLLVATLGSLLITFSMAASTNAPTWEVAIFFILWVLCIVVAIRSVSAPKAWRRFLLTAAVLSFLLPISGLIYTGSFMATHVDSSDQYANAQYAGAAIGGSLISGAMGFVGFFLGIVFLIIGLLVGRDKQIVYVQPQASDTGSNQQ